MSEAGCLRDGNFQNLNVEGNTILKDTSIKGFVSGTATKTLIASESGKIIAVGPAAAGLAGDATFTLPAVENGLFYSFRYFGGATDTVNLLIQTAPNTVGILGGVAHFDTGADDTNGIPDLVYSANADNHLLTVTTPGAGTVIDVICDGTSWFVSGQVCAATAPAFSDV
jgi:hypothetical protein